LPAADQMHRRTLIIAEAGVNHNGDRARALALVEAAARAGADVVKFQSFRAESLATAQAAKAAYQQVTTGSGQSQLEMLRALELSADDEERIAAACAAANITYMSTPFDADSATHLVRRIGVSTLKVGSGDLTNAPLLLHMARLGLPMILSTGMATLAEVEQALGVIAFGYSGDVSAKPAPADFARLLLDRATWTELRAKVTLLHCTTEYPADPQSINLRAMATLRDAFGLPVGFSDHSRGIPLLYSNPKPLPKKCKGTKFVSSVYKTAHQSGEQSRKTSGPKRFDDDRGKNKVPEATSSAYLVCLRDSALSASDPAA